MAFSCINKDDKKIYSFLLSDGEWIDLKSSHNMQLKMSCCNAIAIPKSNKYGCNFFAHKANSCGSSESIEHQYIKYTVLRSLLDSDWTVETEKRLFTPNGELFIADVYAEKDRVKIAIEVQWSLITRDELNRRQEKYNNSGVRCAWLCRKRPWCATKETPIFKIEINKGNPVVVGVIHDNGLFKRSEIHVADFVSKLASGGVKIHNSQTIDWTI